MFRSLHIAATGMSAQERHLDNISNNIANANTVGFKRQRVDFEDLLYQTLNAPGRPTGDGARDPDGLQMGSGVRAVGNTRVFRQGTIETTDNPLDVAIEGRGFLVVQRPDGTQAFTRAGALQTDETGRITTGDGYPIDPPITVPPDVTSLSIGNDGTVSVTLQGDTNPVELGQITLASFVNPAGLLGVGHNLYEATIASGDPLLGIAGTDGRGTLMQGALEKANVNIVDEMIGLISAQRAYEINSKVVSTADQMLQAASQLR